MEYSYTKQLFVLTEFTFNLYQKRCCLVLKNIEQQSTQNNRNENSAL